MSDKQGGGVKNDSDLSDYERARLENIRRNALFLATLGFVESRDESGKTVPENRDTLPNKSKRQKVNSGTSRIKKELQPTRRSARLLSIIPIDRQPEQEEQEKQKEQKEASSEAEYSCNYDDMPMDSNELDDAEFEIYVLLKKWRLDTSRQLDIEPYKICQNRTLAELIRRRRNKVDWANVPKTTDAIEKDLLDCWGIGPSKAKVGGFGYELINIMNTNESIAKQFSLSRSGLK